jgi:hypothetical protein
MKSPDGKELAVTGKVDGNKITWTFVSEWEGNALTVTYVGTLDDNVAAMLALRSDIQEQALSELSQLSAYRPSASGGSAERLTKRVAQAVPASTIAEDDGKPVQRDADQLRSRLSSFQSGTSRGRKASDEPTGQNGVS